MIHFAKAEWLSLIAGDAAADPDLPDGTHLRFIASPLLALPLMPLLVYPWPLGMLESRVTVTGARSDHVMPPPGEPADTDYRVVAVEAIVQGKPDGFSIGIVDTASGRVVTQRSAPPFVVAGPDIRRIRLERGNGTVALRVYRLHPKGLEGLDRSKPLAELPLAAPKHAPWYVGGIEREQALDRVKRGAPPRFSPLDRPNGPRDALPPDAEVARVGASVVEIDRAIAAALADAAVAPWDAARTLVSPGTLDTPEDAVEDRELETVLIATCDPGCARYIGYAETVEQLPPSRSGWPAGLVGVALHAVDPARVISVTAPGSTTLVSRLGDVMAAPDDAESALADALARRVGASELLVGLRKRGLWIRCLIAPAAVTVLPDVPPPPDIKADGARWIAGTETLQRFYRQEFRLRSGTLAPLISMARRDGAALQPRNLPLTTAKGERRIPLIAGTSDQAEERLSDAPVAGDRDTTYVFHAGDLFGRFGEPRSVTASPPEPPKPLPPAPRVALRRRALTHDAGAGLRSPGSVEVYVALPSPESLPVGGLPIVGLRLLFAGQQLSPALPASGNVSAPFAVPALLPGAPGRWPLEAVFIDSAGTESDPARQDVFMADDRRPDPIPAGPGLLWTSRPGPSPEVELRLSWQAMPGTRYRAWFADQRSLDLPDDGVRARVAIAGFERHRDGLLPPGRERFRLLSDAPVAGDPDGIARLQTTLPRALTSVGFLRIVPESEGTVEAEFDQCGVIAVAVPSDQRPPMPRLSVALNDQGQPVLTVRAFGLNIDVLKREEPGFFDSDNVDVLKPQLRLRRLIAGQTGIDAPLYARVLNLPSVMRVNKETIEWTATDAAPLLPFVRYRWWAEVSMPAERRLPAGYNDMPITGGVQAAYAFQNQNSPRPYSLPSAGADLVIVPIALPPAPASMMVTIEMADAKVAAKVRLVGVPVSHVEAIGPHLIRIWLQWGDEAPYLAERGAATSATIFEWTSSWRPATASKTVKAITVLVDPLGREGVETSAST